MSVRTWRVTRVEEGPDAWAFLYDPVDGDGGTFAFGIPKDAFENRMAEHGLESLDEVIEALLYEPLLSWMHAGGDPRRAGQAGRGRGLGTGPAAAADRRLPAEVRPGHHESARGRIRPVGPSGGRSGAENAVLSAAVDQLQARVNQPNDDVATTASD
ncbi:hypothetical protein [Nonomuraea jabiensis]|uniref:Uncharacterized protein n=1 Tax=Nonomuraea jabiensis TaxID=882448 RepID=A0A7W9GCE4_9ACTN|nr:hypothetical protein [Nonomuraea jabiensis]MBB5781071.1 hypothetical protein [Nonomuraea jabiensis]